MTPFPPAWQRATRAHPFITLGIVMGVLLAALVALPFIPRTHGHRVRHAAIGSNANVRVVRISAGGATRYS
jgi:acyl dehydratase